MPSAMPAGALSRLVVTGVAEQQVALAVGVEKRRQALALEAAHGIDQRPGRRASTPAARRSRAAVRAGRQSPSSGPSRAAAARSARRRPRTCGARRRRPSRSGCRQLAPLAGRVEQPQVVRPLQADARRRAVRQQARARRPAPRRRPATAPTSRGGASGSDSEKVSDAPALDVQRAPVAAAAVGLVLGHQQAGLGVVVAAPVGRSLNARRRGRRRVVPGVVTGAWRWPPTGAPGRAAGCWSNRTRATTSTLRPGSSGSSVCHSASASQCRWRPSDIARSRRVSAPLRRQHGAAAVGAAAAAGVLLLQLGRQRSSMISP